MNCVNKQSKEFKKLVADYNVNENTMELLIHQYWIEKKSEEEFPTKAYLNAHLGLTPYKEHINSVIKVWDKLYSHPMVFTQKAKAYKAKYNALKIFPRQAVNLYLDNKGNYRLVVRKPVKNLNAEVDKIVSNGSFSDMTLNYGAVKDKEYQMNVLQSIFNRFNTDRTSKILADKAFTLAKSLNIPVRFSDMQNDNLGKYVPGKGIYLNHDFFASLDNNERKANVILHEVLHAVSNYAISDVVKDSDKPQALLDFKEEIAQIYNKVKDKEALKGERGVVDVKEFIAELSNPIFREKLQQIEEANRQSLWQRIVDAFKKLLNLHSSSDYYTRAMNTLNNALDAFDKNTYMEYNGILSELRKMQGGNLEQLSDKAKAFVDSLSEEEFNNITNTINREISDYELANKTNNTSDNKKEKLYFTFEDGTQVQAPFMPNEQQAQALNIMDKFIHSDETSMTLSGYAGTGKTSLMEILQKKEAKKGIDIIFTATTNKAAAVLKRKVGNAVTLNKAFGINVEVDSSKEYDAKNLVNKIKEQNLIHLGSVVVIDEASMINKQNYAILNAIAESAEAKIIYVGDKAQSAPIKEDKISIVFRDKKGRTVVELTKVERTGDNAILKEATDVRNGIGLSGESSFNKEGKGVAFIKPEQKKEIGEIVRHFAPELKKDPDSFKIIAYTNAKVAAYNEAMRRTLGYKDSTPRVGEPIMGYLNYDYVYGNYNFINSENYRVVEVHPERQNTIYVNGNLYTTTINDITIEGPDGRRHTYAFTDVKHNEHNKQVAFVLGKMVANLWEEYRTTPSIKRRKEITAHINGINKTLFINDDIKEGKRTIVNKVWDFGYAITAHKSQGSTFKNVLIDDVNIQEAKDDEVDLSIPAPDYDVIDTNNMLPAGKVTADEVHDMNGATEVSSTPFSIGEEQFTETKSKEKAEDDTIDKVQQLEYVAISRASDTATIISNNVKKEGSPLHPEKSIKEDMTSTKKDSDAPASYEGMITPDANTVFVFGSNPEGRHGAGAAKVAKEKFGAVYGQGEGLQGNSYALPTKDLRVKENRSLRSIPAEQITESIRKMYDVARQNPSKQFKVAYTNGLDQATLNGYTGAEMIKMFKDAGPIPSNVVFSKNWTDHWNEVKSDAIKDDINSVAGTKNDVQRFNDAEQSQVVIESDRTILSNEELKYWNEQGVGEMPRIITASEHSDPAFHVAEILRVLEGKKSITTWDGKSLSGKDFAGLYLITKHDGLPMRKLLETKIPKLIHFSITGLGDTAYEPGVMKYNDLLDRIQEYLKMGLDPNCVTIRIDPVVPGVTKFSDIENIVKRASEMGIKRIRFSMMDAYDNTVAALKAQTSYNFDKYYDRNVFKENREYERLVKEEKAKEEKAKEEGKEYTPKEIDRNSIVFYQFHAKKEYQNELADFMLSLKDKYGVTLGTCAEPMVREGISKEGCLSVSAVNNMLGTHIIDKGTANNKSRFQCTCYGGKVDVLKYGANCASHCVYCYARHENDKALEYYNEDGTLKDNVFTRTQYGDTINNNNQHSESKIDESLIDQLVSHLKSQGINVMNRDAMAEFLKTHKIEEPQQAIQEQKEMDIIKQKAITDGTFMKAPNGRQSKLTERQWLQVRTTNFKKWFGDWENNPAEASKVVDENGEPLVVYHGTKNNVIIKSVDFSKSDDSISFFTTNDKEHTATSYTKYGINTGNSHLDSIANGILENEGFVDYTKVKQRIERAIHNYEEALNSFFDPFRDENLLKEFIHEDKKLLQYLEDNKNTLNFNASPANIYSLFESLKNPLVVEAKGRNWNKIMFEGSTFSTREIAKIAKERGYDGVIFEDIKDLGIGMSFEGVSYENDVNQPNVYIAFNSNQIKSATDNNGNFSLTDDNIQAFIDNNNQSNTLDKLDEAIRTGNWTEEAIDILENLKLEDYDKILKRFSQEELRKSNGILTQAASIITRRDGRTDQKNPSTDSSRRARQQEQQIESWAKEAGLWYNDYQESSDGSLESVIEADGGKLSDESGSEAMVFFTKNSYKDGVIKAIDASHYIDSPQSLLDKIILHNSIFPETAYEVIGFGRDRGGTFRVIAKQKFVKGEKTTVEDIQKLAKKLGLTKKAGWYYTKDGKRITDLNPKNVIKVSATNNTNEDTFFVIDCDVEFTQEYLQEQSKKSTLSSNNSIETFTTPQGEIYGFVDKDGNIYLDETKISPEHPIHEYTHLWDRTVQKKNPKLWQKGIELMKQVRLNDGTSLWEKVLNDDNYGKVWQSKNISQEKLENLIASEVHSRLVGENGEKLLNDIAKQKGQSDIVAKLKQWILDFWKEVKATFGSWSQDEIDKLTLTDFNHMTIRDFADGINLKDATNATYVEPQLKELNKLLENPASMESSKSINVPLPGYEHFDRDVKNGEQKGIDVDAEWKIPLLKELDSKIYNPEDSYAALGLKYDKDKLHERLTNEMCINQINVLLRRVHSKEEWDNLGLRNKLIKEEYEQNQYDKLARQIDNLNNPMDSDGSKYFDTPLTSSEVKHAVEMAMDYASDIITRLQTEGEEYVKEINPDFQPKKGFDFKTASRQEVIEAVGLSNIFETVHKWFNYSNDWCDSDEALDEAGDKMSFLHENWDAVMWMGAPYFNFNEGFGFKEQIGGRVESAQEDNQLPHDETFNKDSDEDTLVELYGEGREHYLVDSRTVDTIDSMSTLVKRAIHECYKLDKEGNPIVSNTWGLKERVSVKDASLSILSWTQGAVTYEDMLAKLSQKAKLKKNNWINQLLVKLNDNSGQYTDLQSQFFSVFCKHRTAYTVAIDKDGKVASISANKNPVLKQVMEAAKAKFNVGETPLFNSKRINSSLLGNKDSITDKYVFNLHKALHELDTIDKALDIRVNYQRQRKALSEEQIESAAEILEKVMQSVGFTFVKEEIEDILDEGSLHNMKNALMVIVKEMSLTHNYMVNHPEVKHEIAPFDYNSYTGLVGALKNLIRPLTDSLEDITQNTVYDDGKLYQEFTIPSFLTKLFQKFNTKDDKKFDEFLANEYGKSEFFSMGHEFSPRLMKDVYHWRLPWLDMMANNKDFRNFFDHRVNLSYKGKGYMKKMSDLEYAMSVLSQYWSMSSDMSDNTQSYFRMPMQSNKPTEDYIGFVANRNKKTYKKEIVEGTSSKLGLYHMFLTELSRIQTVRMRNKQKGDKSAIKNFDTNGRNFCFFKFLNPYLNGLSSEDVHNGYTTDLLSPNQVFDENGIAIENNDDAKFAQLLQKKIKGEEALTSEEELALEGFAKKAIYNYLQDRFNGILDSWQKNGLVKAARQITNIAESHVSLENSFDKEKQEAEYEGREAEIDSYIKSQLENFLWNDYFATKNILMLTVGDTAFYKDEEDLQKRLAQLHAPGLRGRTSAVDYKGKPVSDGKYRTVILKDFDKVKSNIISNITEVFDRKIATAPTNMKAQWKAMKENVLKAYSEINVADAEGFTSPTGYRKKAIMFGKWSKEAEDIYQKIRKGEQVDFTEIKQAFQPLKPFVYSHLYKTMEVDGAPITNMYCPFQAKNSEYLLVMTDVLLRNEKTSRPNLLKAIFDTMEDSAFDGRQRGSDGKITVDGTYNGKGIDTIQFESAIKSSLQGAVDIAQFAENLAEGESKAKEELQKTIYKEGTEGYNSAAYNTDVFVQELPFEDYCIQQDVPDHFKDHEQAHGSQTRMIIPSDLEEYYDESKDHNDPDNIVKYEYDDWQEVEKGKWEKVHVSKTAKEIKEEYENVIQENIINSLDNLAQELHLNASSRVEQNLALSKILQRELHSSPRYGIDLIQACTIDKVTGEFRIPKGDPIQCKRIEQLINSIIKNRVNKQLIPGGPIVQVSNFGVSRQLHIRFNDKKGKLLPTKEEYDSSKHEGKSYEQYCKENQGGIAYFEVFAPAWAEDLYRDFAKEDGTIDMEAIEAVDPDLLKLITYRIPTEDKCSIAPCKIVGFLPKAAGSTIMLPYELTSQDGSDFDIDKRYVMRKSLHLYRDNKKIAEELFNNINKEKNYNDASKDKLKSNIDTFLKVINSDHAYTAKYLEEGNVLLKKYNELKASGRWKYMFSTARPKDRDMRNNKIIDLSWSILTNPTSADKILKPEGFDEQKKVGYMIAAYRNNPDISWEELEQIANDEDGIKNLKKLSYIEKDLAFFDTQLQFYKQNAAAASLIGVFAVNKIAHSTLEGDGIYLEVPEGTHSFTIGHKVFMKERMELDPRFDTEGNNIGNVLGALVGASADAVKDPILNLMNINMNTANILNALLRLGMSFKEAAMFLSQSVITKALNECDKQNLDGYASIRNIVDEMVKKMNDKNHYSSDSNIVTEEISTEELVEGLLDGEHEALDYKVLIAFNKILDIAEQLRKPTLVTRFNSIAGAVGPLVIDNLMTESKIADFSSADGKSTGFEYKNKDGEWQPATFITILDKHPILEGFYRTYEMANTLFSDTPAGSKGFNKVLNSLGMMRSSVMRNRQLLNSLVNFYASYLLIDSGLVDSSKLEYYIKKFPMEFSRIKDSGKYKGNKLVDAISLREYSNSANPTLQVNITGLDTISKEELSSAWVDLYLENKTLALKLFAYNVFKGGLEFSPKTFISLLPNYIKERIVKKLPDEKKISYLDVFRKLDFSNADPKVLIDQFVRNNWTDNSLVPFVKMSKEMQFADNTLFVTATEDKVKVSGDMYIKIKIGKDLKLLRYDKDASDSSVEIYKVIEPLGNNGEYLEMANYNIVKAMPVSTQAKEKGSPIANDNVNDMRSTSNPQLSNDNFVESGTAAFTDNSTQKESTQEESRKALSLAEMFMAFDNTYTKAKAEWVIGNYKRNIEERGNLPEVQINRLKEVFAKQGLKLNGKEALAKFKEMC